ncbi:MAG: hypothetical protein WC544_00420 [Patescibacteria group bacterium]
MPPETRTEDVETNPELQSKEAVDSHSGQEVRPEHILADRKLIETRRHDFEILYKYMKMYQDEGWTLMKIESASPQLSETLGVFKDVLKAAGRYDVDGLLEGLLTEVRRCHEEKKDKHDFIEDIFDHTKMSGGPVQNFYEAFVAGLKAQQESRSNKLAA